ncbi:MAG: TetR/AcrR family transcriptional regulator [Chloroflexota bacterium]
MSPRRPRDKERTVQDILSAARQLFSEKGLHGVSFQDIEDASGVSRGLIIHHYGNKEALYAAVQEDLNREYVAMMAAQRQKSGNLQEMITNAVRSSFEHAKGNRQYRRVALWSYLEGHESATEIEKAFTTNLITSMRAGQEAGLVRRDIDAFFMPFIIKGTIEYWIQKEKLIQELSASEQATSELAGGQGAEERLIEVLARLFTSGD